MELGAGRTDIIKEKWGRLLNVEKRSPAMCLAGLSIDGGWRITALIPRDTAFSNSLHSVSYAAEHEDGRIGFLKALDYSAAIEAPDFAAAMQQMTQAFLHEREILKRCGERKLRKIVKALHAGEIRRDEFAFPVNYIIFERAEGDLRGQLELLDRVDDVWRLQTLHQIATGVYELHGLSIAHQDVKPANVLQFREGECKVSDLGRSMCKGVPCPHEADRAPGTKAYGPPEWLYSDPGPLSDVRRFGYDAYQLGSMGVYLFTGMSATSLLLNQLHDSHRPANWNGSFGEVLPYLHEAFSGVLEGLERDLVLPEAKADLLTVIRQLCEPDPRRRGHPRDRARPETQYSLERYVSAFDMMAKRVQWSMYRR
jgi:serine/threonine protein kinase